MYVDFNCPNCKRLTVGRVVDDYFSDFDVQNKTVSQYTEIECMDCGCQKQFETIYQMELKTIGTREEITYKGDSE